MVRNLISPYQEMDLDHLSPMWADWKGNPHRHFYVKELARLKHGQLVIPLRWIIVDGVVHADAFAVTSQTSKLTILQKEVIRFEATQLADNVEDILSESSDVAYSGMLGYENSAIQSVKLQMAVPHFHCF